MKDAYYSVPGLRVSLVGCKRCGAVIDRDAMTEHDNFHLKVEAALSQAQGFTLEGEPFGWNR